MTRDTAMPNNKVHEGRNVKRFREMLGIKQDALAACLGDDWNQQKVSLLEQKESISVPLLQQISAVLKVPVEALQNFDEEQAVNIISNTFHDTQGFINYNPTFTIHPVEELRKLHDEKMALYEKMIKAQDEMIARFEKLMEKK